MPKTKKPLPIIDLEKARERAVSFLEKMPKQNGSKANKLLQKKVVKKTGKICLCGGSIVKVKFWEIREKFVRHPVVFGPGSGRGCYRELEPEDLTEKFTPLHCEDCGVQYFKLPK